MRTKTIHRAKIIPDKLPIDLSSIGELNMSSSEAAQYFSLRWNNYQSNMTSVFHQLLETQSFVDVSLACEDSTLKAHKVVLSACSAYFKKILLDNPCKHPTIILPSEISFNDLKSIIEFVYRGEIDVSEAELQCRESKRRKSNSSIGTHSKYKSNMNCMPSSSKRCYKAGIITRNPFLNFLRVYRESHCGLSIIDIAKQGAIEWRKMTDEQKCKYVMQAVRAPRRRRQKRFRSKNRIHRVSKRSIKIKKER